MQHMQEPIPSMCECNSLLPLQMDEFIRKAMAKKREERYQTAAESSAALVTLLDGAVSTSVLRRLSGKVEEEGAKPALSEQYKQIVALYANPLARAHTATSVGG